jgi:diguanylate cyclase (GGDEF)-like protein
MRRKIQIALALAALTIIGSVDQLTGFELWMSPLYFVPIASAAWSLGRAEASALGVFSTILWVVASYRSGRSASSGWYLYADVVVQLAAFSTVAWVISAHRRLFDREAKVSRVDWLTGLLNLRALRERAEIERSRLMRGGPPMTVVYLDLDRFKNVNDSSGHAVGDKVLEAVSETFRRLLRSVDLSARVGGDEFVLFLNGTGMSSAPSVLERIRGTLESTMKSHGWAVTASIGAVVYQGPTAPSVDRMLSCADAQMYRSKRSGRNRVEVCDADALPKSAPAEELVSPECSPALLKRPWRTAPA